MQNRLQQPKLECESGEKTRFPHVSSQQVDVEVWKLRSRAKHTGVKPSPARCAPPSAGAVGSGASRWAPRDPRAAPAGTGTPQVALRRPPNEWPCCRGGRRAPAG